MTRKFFFFSEMGYNAYPLEALEQYGYSALLFPNSIFDPEKARDLWQMFLREHEYASEMGFDGSVCNEHHNNVLSMQESVNISAAVISQRIKGTIALIGNPLPIHDNPVRVAEEIAMLDLISGGRIISGFVRGTGIEQLSTNANPAYNRERFEEAFALIKKTWTVPGPFRWEGKHYHMRVRHFGRDLANVRNRRRVADAASGNYAASCPISIIARASRTVSDGETAR